MNRDGAAASMLSCTTPGIWFGDPEESAMLAREMNEFGTRMKNDHPGRYGLFALLPLPSIELSLKEIEYAFDVLKADGVAFMTSYADKFLGDPAFAPVMDELNRRKVTAYTHPNEPACCRNLNTGVPSVIIEYGTDTTRTIASLIYSGTAQRCPNINFIFSHAGGTITALTERFNTQAVRLPNLKAQGFDYDVVMRLLKRFYYDTANASNPWSLAPLLKLVSVSQVLLGSDFPLRSPEANVSELIELGFSAGELRAIFRDNAIGLLPRLAA